MRRIAMSTSGVLVALGIWLIGVVGVSAAEDTQQADLVAQHLQTFDELDFEVFSGQAWDRLNESHANDIVVTWPDGHETKGIATHIEDLKSDVRLCA